MCPNSYRLNLSGRHFLGFDSNLLSTIKFENLFMKAKYFKKSETEKEFYNQLKSKVYQKLEGKIISHGDFRFWFKGVFWTLVCYFSYSLLFLESSTKMEFWVLFVIFQLSGLLIGFSFGHDASHNTAFKNKKANGVLHFFSFLTVGIDPLLWGLRHIRSHHLYANVEGSDVDIDRRLKFLTQFYNTKNV